VNTPHLHALELGLYHEKQRLAAAKSESERQLRQVWVNQRQKEIDGERKFLGLSPVDSTVALTDDELLAALGSK